jgi:uroporphyrinogen-III decarboxylase
MTDHGQKYYHFQKGFQRVADAATGIPDRVPLYAQVCELLPHEMNVSAKEIFHNAELLTIGTLDVCAKHGIDVPSVDFDVYNIEAEAVGQKVIFDDAVMPDVDRAHQLLQDKSELKKLRTPDFDKAGRCPLVVEIYRRFQAMTGVKASLAFCAPFSLAANLRGMEHLIMDTYDDPEFVKALFDFVTNDLLIPWLSYLKEKFPHAPAIVGADAMASLPIINEEIMERWVVPYIERLRHAIGQQLCVPNQTGEHYSKHPEEFMDIRRKANPLYVEGQDPDVESLGPEFYKQYAQKHGLPLLLGVGAVFLNNSTPAEITARIKHYIQVGGRDGRLWLYLCNLSPTTPAENINAAVAAVRKYGTYSK